VDDDCDDDDADDGGGDDADGELFGDVSNDDEVEVGAQSRFVLAALQLVVVADPSRTKLQTTRGLLAYLGTLRS